MHTPKITQILKDSEYKLELFSQESIENLESKIKPTQSAKSTPRHERERERESSSAKPIHTGKCAKFI